VEEIRDSDIGTRAGLFEVLKIGDEFYSFIVDCQDPKACTILLRGASKDVLNEVHQRRHATSPPTDNLTTVVTAGRELHGFAGWHI
jgi:chaperonin GroEL (HSP60 family)